jgi:hypothetical protein
MREAIETQAEMEVGTPVTDKQEEVKQDEQKEVTVDKGSGTQIIINIAGKKKVMEFSNVATANAFIKGASTKFGDKFQVVSNRPDQCPKCGSLNNSTYYKDGRRYDPFEARDKHLPLWDIFKCDDCGHQWPFKFIHIYSPAQGVDNNAPVTSGKSDIDGGAPNLKSGAAGEESFKTDTQGVMEHLDSYRGWEIERNPHGLIVVSKSSGAFPFIAKSVEQAKQVIDKKEAEWEASAPREYVIMVGNQYVVKSGDGTFRITPSIDKAYRYDALNGAYEAKQDAVEVKNGIANGQKVQVVPAKTGSSTKMTAKEAGFSFAPPQIGSQVLVQFYPEIMHEVTEYPNATNSPMPAQMTGDPHETPSIENEELLPGAIEDAFNGMNRIGYISTSPAGGMGIGRDGKPQVLEGAPLRKENDIRGPMFTDEFYQNYDAPPGASIVLASKIAAGDEKKQFGLFLKRVMGEVAATFIAAFKATTRMPMNKIPGVGEIQLAQVEQPVASTFNVVNTGSRVKYLMEKLTDSELQDCINEAFAQGAVWCESQEGGYVYEVFVRSETIDTESMIMRYKFITGTKDAE